MPPIQGPSSGNRPHIQEGRHHPAQRVKTSHRTILALSVLTLAPAVAGVVLTLAFGNPIFLTIIVASVVFALVACAICMRSDRASKRESQTVLLSDLMKAEEIETPRQRIHSAGSSSNSSQASFAREADNREALEARKLSTGGKESSPEGHDSGRETPPSPGSTP